MARPPDWEDDAPRSDPVYAVSRVAAPGGVPLDISIPALIVVAMLTVFVNPLFMVAAPVGFRLLQKWINQDLQKPRILFGYLTGAALSSDPVVIRPDGTKGRRWGGSTVAPLPNGPAGGTPRYVDLPRD